MKGLLRAEWIKITKRGVLPVTTAVLLLLSGLSAVILLVVPDVAPDAIEGLPRLSRSDASILGVQTITGQSWFPLILAVVMFGSEVTRSAWAAALTRESRRSLHVAARLVVLTLAAWVAGMVAIGLWEVLAAAFTDGPAAFDAVGWFGVIWKLLLVQATWVALGLGAIALLRSTGVAIGVVIAFSFVDSILSLWGPYNTIALTPASAALFGEVTADVSGGFGVGVTELVGFTHALAVVVGWIVVGVALAWVGVRYREA